MATQLYRITKALIRTRHKISRRQEFGGHPMIPLSNRNSKNLNKFNINRL